MNEVMQTFLMEHLFQFATIITLCVLYMLVAMTVDLIMGVRKAKMNGEATTSTGLKKTCDKARKYFSPFIGLMCVDIIAACAGVKYPCFSMLWTIYCDFCEFVSIREKAWQKADIRKQERTMKVILENKDDIVKMLAELINTQAGEKGEKDESN